MESPIRGPRPAHSKALDMTLAAALFVIGFFGLVNSSFSQLPISTGAPSKGQKAPAFSLPDQNGKIISLAELLKPAGAGKPGGLLLIFYRGYW